jgi:UDP:flavonoid glycosyltransferase YjiC (YdhE family)
MSKILFLNHAQMGHLNPLLTIALQMKKEGHKTEFLVPGVENPPIELEIFKTASAVPKLIQKAGLEVKMISPPICAAILSPILPLLSGYNEFMFAIELSSLGIKNYTYSILKHIEQNKPDALVTDFTFYSAYIAAEVSNIPCTTIYHSGLPFKGKIVPPFATGLPINENIEVSSKKFLPYEKFILSRLDRRINKARKHFGLSSVETEMLYRPYSKWLNLITSAEAIEAPRDNLTENTFFVGPCFEERKEDSSNFPFDKLDKDKYKNQRTTRRAGGLMSNAVSKTADVNSYGESSAASEKR